MAIIGDHVKLVGFWASPYVVRAAIALNLKGIEYDFIQEEFGNKSELLLSSNPVHKKVPVLIHGEKPICESLVIIQYIDEVWPASGAPILPTDPYERAVARFWGAYIDDKLSPQLRVLKWDADEGNKEVAKEHLFAVLLQLEEALVKCGNGKSFFGGDTIGFIDIALGSYVGWLNALEKIVGIKFFDEEKIPRLVEWANCFCSTTATKGVVMEAEELAEFRKVNFATRNAVATSKEVAAPSNK